MSTDFRRRLCRRQKPPPRLGQMLRPGLRPGRILRPAKTRGGALLAVLWLSAGLAAIALSVSSNVRSETDRVSPAGDGLRASYLASGALERGILWVLWGNSGFNYAAPDGLPRFWNSNMRRLPMRFPSGDAL